MYYFAFIKSAYETKFFIFSYERVQKIWKTAVYHFSASYLVLELKSFEDVKVKAKSMDTKHVILCNVTYIEYIFNGFQNDHIDLQIYQSEPTETLQTKIE